ncbi:MAG: hypothetical protein QF535_01305, partial [Anaerolineales bacterium]|nr:hypothetical protein [Anaerolineales bacterium]
MTLDKIVVVKRDTELEDLQKRHVTRSQVRFYLASQGQSLEVFEARHEGYHQSLDAVQGEIPTRMRSQVVSKDQLATYQFGDSDLVVVVGDEGLVVNAAKYVGSQP